MIKVFTPLYALLTGAIWSILTGITIAVTLALLTGLAIKPVLWAFLLTGIVGAAWIGLRPIIQRDQRHRLITIAVHAIGVLLFSLFQPFTLSFGESTLWQLLALIGFAVVQSWMMQNILAKLDRNSIKRRNLELSFITSMASRYRSSLKCCKSANASLSCCEFCRFRRTALASVLWAMPRAFRAIG